MPAALIGDLSQPRGGLMGYGHRSHQIGLDADIWFSRPSVKKRNKDEYFPSLVNRKTEKIHSKRLNARSIKMLRTAAEDPRVARIFVHWVIKNALCKMSFENRDWLGKIRAWYGHDRHFHVRLKCPKDSPDCVDQRVIPPGDGCGAERYFSRARVQKRKAKEEAAKKRRLAAARKAPKPTSWAIFLHRTHRVMTDPKLIFETSNLRGGDKKRGEFDAGLESILEHMVPSLTSSVGQYLAHTFLGAVFYTASIPVSEDSIWQRFIQLPQKRPYWRTPKGFHRRCAIHLLMNARTEKGLPNSVPE